MTQERTQETSIPYTLRYTNRRHTRMLFSAYVDLLHHNLHRSLDHRRVWVLYKTLQLEYGIRSFQFKVLLNVIPKLLAVSMYSIGVLIII